MHTHVEDSLDALCLEEAMELLGVRSDCVMLVVNVNDLRLTCVPPRGIRHSLTEAGHAWIVVHCHRWHCVLHNVPPRLGRLHWVRQGGVSVLLGPLPRPSALVEVNDVVWDVHDQRTLLSQCRDRVVNVRRQQRCPILRCLTTVMVPHVHHNHRRLFSSDLLLLVGPHLASPLGRRRSLVYAQLMAQLQGPAACPGPHVGNIVHQEHHSHASHRQQL
mmetsp:Transcript_15975/g.62408  ORF Transcript_15975/g.62408 Transcript_15975/m.62408 type:complete len:217 (-) Transcript_15975:80-730(-)